MICRNWRLPALGNRDYDLRNCNCFHNLLQCKLKIIFGNFAYSVQNRSHWSHCLSVWWCCSIMTDGFWAVSSLALLCACVSCGAPRVCVCVYGRHDSMMDGGLLCVSPALSILYVRERVSPTLLLSHMDSHTLASALERTFGVRFCNVSSHS